MGKTSFIRSLVKWVPYLLCVFYPYSHLLLNFRLSFSPILSISLSSQFPLTPTFTLTTTPTPTYTLLFSRHLFHSYSHFSFHHFQARFSRTAHRTRANHRSIHRHHAQHGGKRRRQTGTLHCILWLNIFKWCPLQALFLPCPAEFVSSLSLPICVIGFIMFPFWFDSYLPPFDTLQCATLHYATLYHTTLHHTFCTTFTSPPVSHTYYLLHQIPGHALVMQQDRPFRGLASFGNNFLSKFEGAEVK